MYNVLFCLCLGWFSGSLMWSPVPEALSSSDVTNKMQRQLNNVKSLSADFVLTSYLGPLEEGGSTTGNLMILKKQNKLRLEQYGQTIVSDGESVWTYIPENEQIIVSPSSPESKGLRPDEFLFYYTERYTSELVKTEPLDDVLHYVMKLTAKDDMAELKEVTIWVDNKQWLTQQVLFTDDMGSSTKIRFSNIRLNPDFPKETFVMQVPDGVEVVDLR